MLLVAQVTNHSSPTKSHGVHLRVEMSLYSQIERGNGDGQADPLPPWRCKISGEDVYV